MCAERERERAACAIQLLDELQRNRLVVIKWPSHRGGYVRGSIAQNPPWYQELCAGEQRGRRRFPRPRTVIRRKDTLRALEKIAAGFPCDGIYMERLLAVVDQQIELRKEVA